MQNKKENYENRIMLEILDGTHGKETLEQEARCKKIGSLGIIIKQKIEIGIPSWKVSTGYKNYVLPAVDCLLLRPL